MDQLAMQARIYSLGFILPKRSDQEYWERLVAIRQYASPTLNSYKSPILPGDFPDSVMIMEHGYNTIDQRTVFIPGFKSCTPVFAKYADGIWRAFHCDAEYMRPREGREYLEPIQAFDQLLQREGHERRFLAVNIFNLIRGESSRNVETVRDYMLKAFAVDQIAITDVDLTPLKTPRSCDLQITNGQIYLFPEFEIEYLNLGSVDNL